MNVALVTGGARRIGAAICRELHDHGWHVIVHYNRSETDARQLIDAMNDRRPGSAAMCQADLTDAPSALAEKSMALFGQLNLLVNNASLFTPDSAGAKGFDQMMTTNARSPLLLTQLLADTLRGGSVVNIIDIHGSTPLRNYTAYSASKAALQMLTRSLALELAPAVRVNGVAPGAILWPEDTAEMSDSEKTSLLESIPMQSLGEPSDIARAVRFLAEDAPFVTGQVIAVDGGQTIENTG